MSDLLTNLKNIKKREIELLYSESIFDIELSSRCNINCIMCPRIKLTRKHEIMPLDLIISKDNWFPICKLCDDEYRYLLLANNII